MHVYHILVRYHGNHVLAKDQDIYISSLFCGIYTNKGIFNIGYISLSYGILLGLKSTLYNHCGEAEINSWNCQHHRCCLATS